MFKQYLSVLIFFTFFYSYSAGNFGVPMQSPFEDKFVKNAAFFTGTVMLAAPCSLLYGVSSLISEKPLPESDKEDEENIFKMFKYYLKYSFTRVTNGFATTGKNVFGAVTKMSLQLSAIYMLKGTYYLARHNLYLNNGQ